MKIVYSQLRILMYIYDNPLAITGKTNFLI